MFNKSVIISIISILICISSNSVFSQTAPIELDMKEVFTEYARGNYEGAAVKIKPIKVSTNKEKALKHYWRGIIYARLNDFESAGKYLRSAIDLGHESADLFYEYGQALYVANNYKNARIAFKKSFNRNYKRGVSLYYIAIISKEMKEIKKAVKFFNMIEKLPADESKDVLQASKVQIADIYLEKIEALPDSIKDIEKYVIPQYREALEINEDSKLADEVKLKIHELQRKYELVLFRMRNGRPTARPPHYVRANLLYGTDSNVNLLSDDNQSVRNEEDISSAFVRAGVFGRYSFYPNSAVSFAPELNITTVKYLSDSDEIKALNAHAITTGATMNFEHLFNDEAATFYINLSYTYNSTYDVSDEAYEYSGNDVFVTLSEELRFWKNHPSTFRFRYGNTTTQERLNSFNSHSFIWEQIVNFDRTILFFTNSYTVNTYREVDNETENTNQFSTRLDAIFPTFYGLFNPTLYAAHNSSDYFEDSTKGTIKLTTLGLNLNRPLSKNFYLTVDYSANTQAGKLDEDNYTRDILTVNFDYIY